MPRKPKNHNPEPADRIEPTAPPNSEVVNIHLLGTRQAVLKTIQLLHSLGFVDAGAWSRPIAVKNQDQVLSVTSRPISVD